MRRKKETENTDINKSNFSVHCSKGNSANIRITTVLLALFFLLYVCFYSYFFHAHKMLSMNNTAQKILPMLFCRIVMIICICPSVRVCVREKRGSGEWLLLGLCACWAINTLSYKTYFSRS